MLTFYNFQLKLFHLWFGFRLFVVHWFQVLNLSAQYVCALIIYYQFHQRMQYQIQPIMAWKFQVIPKLSYQFIWMMPDKWLFSCSNWFNFCIHIFPVLESSFWRSTLNSRSRIQYVHFYTNNVSVKHINLYRINWISDFRFIEIFDAMIWAFSSWNAFESTGQFYSVFWK